MSQYEDDVEALPEAPPEPSTSAQRYENPTRELSPEPDLDLDLSRGSQQAWLVKVPKFLIDGWSQVRQDDQRLGTVRVYDPDASGNQRMELLLPDAPQPAIPIENPQIRAQFASVPRAYDMRLTSTTQDTFTKNLYAFEERQVEDDDADLGDDEETQSYGLAGSLHVGRPPSKKKRTTALTGMVTNETALQPRIRAPQPVKGDVKSSAPNSRSMITPEYRNILRNRRNEMSKPKRTVMMMDDTDAGMNNMLAAGVRGHVKSHGANLVMANQARNQRGAEKFARMPRNELLDLLFSLFDRYKHWSLKRLREETQQPYVYLREVLSSIADQHHNGPYAGSWSLKREFSEARRDLPNPAGPSRNGAPSGPSDGQPRPPADEDNGDLEDVI